MSLVDDDGNDESVRGRYIEVPAAGTFLITEQTREGTKLDLPQRWGG
jgi:hypothetical protein